MVWKDKMVVCFFYFLLSFTLKELQQMFQRVGSSFWYGFEAEALHFIFWHVSLASFHFGEARYASEGFENHEMKLSAAYDSVIMLFPLVPFRFLLFLLGREFNGLAFSGGTGFGAFTLAYTSGNGLSSLPLFLSWLQNVRIHDRCRKWYPQTSKS